MSDQRAPRALATMGSLPEARTLELRQQSLNEEGVRYVRLQRLAPIVEVGVPDSSPFGCDTSRAPSMTYRKP
jgi:hypothetical protein